MTNKTWSKLLTDEYDEILEAMEKAYRNACESAGVHFCVAMEPDGTIYSYEYVGNHSEPESVWDGTDLFIFGAVDEVSSWRDACMAGFSDSYRAAYSQYLADDETIPDDIDDYDVLAYVRDNYPHCIEDFDEDAIDWIVGEELDSRIDCLDKLIADYRCED